MKTVYYTAASLDGFIADAENSLDWLMQFSTDGGEDYPDFIAGIGALAMGSTTYEWVRPALQLISAQQKSEAFVQLRYLVPTTSQVNDE